jgi:tetratricopeptide (TPR) repeat protein
MGNAKAAKESLDRAAAIYETLDHNTASDCSIELAKTYKTLDMEDKSVELFKNTVLNNHTDDNLVNDIRQTLTALNIDESHLNAIDALREEVVSLNKQGVELARKGQLEEATELLKKTSARMPANKVVNLNTALVLLMDMERSDHSTSNIDEINVYLKRVAMADPNNPTLKKLQNKLNSVIKKAAEES